MKFLVLILAFTSLTSFASELPGYVCLGKDDKETKKLDKIAKGLGSDYLTSVGIVIVKRENCSEVHAMMYSDVCTVGKYTIQVGLENEATIKVGKKEIQLICEVDGVVDAYPSLGGSN